LAVFVEVESLVEMAPLAGPTVVGETKAPGFGRPEMAFKDPEVAPEGLWGIAPLAGPTVPGGADGAEFWNPESAWTAADWSADCAVGDKLLPERFDAVVVGMAPFAGPNGRPLKLLLPAAVWLAFSWGVELAVPEFETFAVLLLLVLVALELFTWFPDEPEVSDAVACAIDCSIDD